jgi:hypothetical protein
VSLEELALDARGSTPLRYRFNVVLYVIDGPVKPHTFGLKLPRDTCVMPSRPTWPGILGLCPTWK